MKIALDARWIFPEISGIGAYTQELIRHLALMDRENEYVLFFDREDARARVAALAQLQEAPNFRPHMLPFGIFSARGQIELPRLLRRQGIDVFHSPNYMIPLFAFPRRGGGRVRCVVTIHDVIPLLFPDYAPRARKARLFPLYRRLMREVSVRASVILTDSECSRRDVIRQLRIPPSQEHKVCVVPIGVGPEFRPAAKRSRAPKTVLYVGRLDPYKNVPGVVRTFARVRALHGGEVRLRIVGPQDPRYPEARELARELGVESWIDWAGYVSDGELVAAYQQADVFVLQSKYEGFGLTVLEAMACGTPVVCSRRSSVPEVAGNAAVLVDPDNPDEVAAAVVRILGDAALAADLRDKGIRQAAKFTWGRAGAMTLKVYEHAVKG